MFKLTDHDRVLLRLKQRHQRQRREYVKITTLLMLDSGFSAAETAEALGIDESTVHRYVQRFENASSIQEYLSVNYRGSQPKLSDEQVEVLLEELSSRLYYNAASVAAFIGERFSIVYAERSVRHLLRRLGFRFKKTSPVPAKADPQDQRRFLRYRLRNRLKRARRQGEPVYFCDAVHPQYSTRATNAWIARAEPWHLPSHSGAQRLHLHGALNAEDPSDVLVLCSRRINTASTIALFDALQQNHPSGRIHVVCDNASYYHSRDLRSWLKNSRIHLLHLPPYAPNLNVIERLWKYLRKTVIDTTSYPSFSAFAEGVTAFFENIHDHAEKLRHLLTLNFHIPETLAI